jgi:hypothetical protein
MKLVKYFSLIIAAAFCFSACETDLEKIQMLPDTEVVAPVLHSVDNTEINITSDNGTTKLVLEWDKAYFGEGIIFSYYLYFTYGDTELFVNSTSNKKEVEDEITEEKSIVDVTSMELTYSQIKQLMTNTVDQGGFGIAENTPSEIKAHLVARVGETGKEYSTEAITFTVTVVK